MFLGTATAAAVVMVAAVCGVMALHLAQGPIPAEWVRDRLAQSLAGRIGKEATVFLDSAEIDRQDGETKLKLGGFSLVAPDGRRIVGAPQAVIHFDPWAALVGHFAPRRIDLVGLEIRVKVDETGRAAVFAGADSAEPGLVPAATLAAPALAVIGADASSAAPPAAGGWQALVAAVLDDLVRDDGPLQGFDGFGLRGGRIVVDEAVHGRRIVLEDIAVDLGRDAPGQRKLAVSGSGATGRWSALVTASRETTGSRSLAFELSALTLGDLAVALGKPLPFGAATPVSGSGRLRLDSTGAIADLAAQVRVGAFTVPEFDPDTGPIPVSAIAADIGWDERGKTILLRRVEASVAGAAIVVAGRGRFDPATGFTAEIETGSAEFDAVGQGFAPVVFATLSGRVAVGLDGAIAVERLDFQGPEVDGRLSGKLALGEGGEGLRLTLDGLHATPSSVLRLWPPLAVSAVRSWLIDRLDRGKLETITLDVALSPADLEAITRREPIPEESVRLEFRATGGVFRALAGLPPIAVDEVRGRVTGRALSLTFPSGSLKSAGGKPMALSEGRVEMADLSRQQPVMQLAFRVQGPAAGLFELVESDALKAASGGAPPGEVEKGASDLRLNLAFPVTRDLTAADVAVQGEGSLTGLSVAKAFGPEALTDANLGVKIERGQVAMKGDAKLVGLPTTLDFRKSMRGSGGEAALTVTVDEAFRAKRGFPASNGLAGPVQARILAAIGGKDPKLRFEIDLARAAIDGLVPGWTKPAGRPAKVNFALQMRAGGYDLSDFQADSAGFMLRGQIGLDRDFNLRSARLDRARMSPGDEAKVEIERGGSGVKAVVRAAVIDARPYLKMLFGGREGDDKKTDIDLDLKSPIVTGHNAEALSNVEMRFVRAGGEIRTFSLSGRFGPAPVNAQLARRSDGVNVVVLQSANAGASLRFLDLYRRMAGGTLLLQTTAGGAREDGILTIRSFGLKDEPGLKRVLADPAMVAPKGEGAERFAAPAPTPPAADGVVEFEKLRASFIKRPGRIDMQDAVMWGPQIGASVEGVLDFAKNHMNVTGTFVPAYALNNVFASVPLIGPLLGGGQHGGLFAVNFRVSGKMSEPQLTINPLSAIAPGFLRKFFEFSRATDIDPPPVSAARRPESLR